MTDAIPYLLAALLAANLAVLAVLVVRRPPSATGEISEAWTRLGLGESIGRVEQHADDMGRASTDLAVRLEREAAEVRRSADEIHRSYRTIQQMLRSPVERGSFAEISLELLLADGLPSAFYGVRERIASGKIPDAHIRTPDGMVCIDSKFPLDNFARWAEAPEDMRAPHMKALLRDTERHLKKVAEDYVRPDQGTAPFALMFVASESVYYALATHGHDLLRKYVGLGVQVLSPLLMAHKLEVLRLGLRAMRLNEDARSVLASLQGLAIRFRAVDEAWQVFHATHLRNLTAKAAEIDDAYRRLGLEFRRVESECGGTAGPETPPPAKMAGEHANGATIRNGNGLIGSR